MDLTPALSLSLLGILIGLVLLGTHLFALLTRNVCLPVVRSIPRSRAWGTALLAITTLWLVAFVHTADLGEFSPMRNMVTLASIAGAFLLWKFVPDFLASRSLGFLLLLAAHPVLETTFLQSGFLHFALAALAYVWAVAGLFLVGMPYLHRDAIAWISASKGRWNLACWVGILYGVALLIDGLRLTILG
jgi:hypothetical protein